MHWLPSSVLPIFSRSFVVGQATGKITGEYKQLQASEPAIEIWKIGLKKGGEALG
jgi:hypothetical protein